MQERTYDLFVYGTLRKGAGNHDFLKNARLLAEQCWINGELYDTGDGYPVLKQSIAGKVYGEVYQVNDQELELIDRLEDYVVEGEDNLYERIEQTVHTDKGSIRAFVYVAGKQLESCQQLIRNGDWKEYMLWKVEQPIYYFAYGSCMDNERFKQAGVDPFFQFVMGKGMLDGYTLRFTYPSADGGKADIVEEGGTVEGKVYIIDQETLHYLYEREGVAKGVYRPTFVSVQLKSKQRIEALTFVVVDKKAETAPSENYALEIVRGGTNCVNEKYLMKIKEHITSLVEEST
ncbi:gamma-glutamylcyclotransferase [Halalkalibacter urbisdiaboli]|uniref:gamma-glutamylcyclotransferase n=1 Tax=Halalkalibacter urbisdiaboli TaxID=1960589 RepID=UPI000B453B48|nr:gamma-glutamylcyclotransferase family protein [Halalkalibacter urbisdiaboli]